LIRFTAREVKTTKGPAGWRYEKNEGLARQGEKGKGLRGNARKTDGTPRAEKGDYGDNGTSVAP